MVCFKVQTAFVWAAALTTIVTQSDAKALPDLRILPIGDSITKGSKSSDGNGYREKLRNRLLAYDPTSGAKVDMIGTLRNGNMADSDNEGHPGEYIENIITYWQKPFAAEPNLVLIHIGTNNMDKNKEIPEAPARLATMIDEMFAKLPNIVIVVAEVIHSKTAEMNKRSDAFNAKLREIVRSRSNAGKHILIVDMGIVNNELKDDKHPNDKGYAKMAEGWYQKIIQAHEAGWLKSHGDASPPNLGIGIGGNEGHDASCKGGNWKKVGNVFNDYRVWEEVGSIHGGTTNFGKKRLILADLTGDGLTDYILAEADGTVSAFRNGGLAGGMVSLGNINPPWKDVTGDMVRMADVTGDGKADMIALYSDGAAKVWKNMGDGRKFEPLDSKWATGLESREKIQFVDIDGDGAADYVILYDGGAVKWARNTKNNGADSSKRNWESLQEIAPGVSGIPPKSVRLVDLDGDKRADYVIIYADGSVKALRNSGNLNRNPNRRNWQDLGTIAPGISGVTGDKIWFADMTGDHLADFLVVEDDGSIRMWSNQGLVGAGFDNIRFADLTGDGRDDLIYVDPVGRARAWLNKGVGKWEKFGEIATIRTDEDLSDARIEFADVNGDKRADYLIIYGGGAVKVWLNNGALPNPRDGQRIWQPNPIVIANGVAGNDDGGKVRFADLNGDGYDDYLVLWDGGAVDAYLNQHHIPPKDGERIWKDKETVATGVGQPGSKIRFVQLNDDGKADYLVQYDGGAARAYLNTGDIPGSQATTNWLDIKVVAAGVKEQGPVIYADLDGDSKDDYLVVYPDGSISAWLNACDWKVNNPDGGDDGGDNTISKEHPPITGNPSGDPTDPPAGIPTITSTEKVTSREPTGKHPSQPPPTGGPDPTDPPAGIPTTLVKYR